MIQKIDWTSLKNLARVDYQSQFLPLPIIKLKNRDILDQFHSKSPMELETQYLADPIFRHRVDSLCFELLSLSPNAPVYLKAENGQNSPY
ncbi:MAG: hypothetical protein RBG13Loki_1458 [Promethearchaeota archaeon CR_4]|nr:MAG: hypothetical protein RBG13Loki_1458 [Candidatus Lokiarchaeota archaeon CR_4]